MRRGRFDDKRAEKLHNGNVGVIGDTLSEARTRRAVDLEEVEAATGIRPRYLRAIEGEDWDALPEEFYARSFIRKYAQFLGVDPEPLVEEYRRQRGTAGRGEAPTSPFARTGSRRAEALRRRRKRRTVYTWAGAALLVVGVVAGIALLVGGGGGSNEATNVAGNGKGKAGEKGAGKGGTAKHAAGANAGKAGAIPGKGGGANGTGGESGAHAGEGGAAPRVSRRFFRPTTVKLAIEPTAEVWACVLDATGKPLVDGVTLSPGETVGPFRSHSYTAAFGNGSVTLTLDGKRVKTPATPSPIGFTVDPQGNLRQLPEGQRPSCE
jgi:cytoskeleton protein RodZ